MAIIEARGLARTFTSRKRTVHAVRGVDLTVEPGEIVGFLGPNGAGKTTTLRMLTTLLEPTAGSATVAGADLLRDPLGVRRRIGYVPQALSADANLTGMENVELFARLFDVPRKVRARRVADALEAMGLTDAATRLAGCGNNGPTPPPRPARPGLPPGPAAPDHARRRPSRRRDSLPARAPCGCRNS